MINKKTAILFLITVLAFTAGFFCFSGCGKPSRVVGVSMYDYQGDFDKMFSEMTELGINTVFIVSEELIENPEFHTKAREHDVDVFISASVFHNPGYLGKHPEDYAITDSGGNAIQSWLRFVCPSREAYRQECIDKYVQYVKDYDPAGLEINFIRYFIYWETILPDTPAEDLPNSCYCDVCLERFQNETGVTIDPDMTDTPEIAAWITDNCEEEFTAWKCENIASFVRDISIAVKEVKPDIIIQAFVVPWMQDDYDNGIRRVVGQDYSLWTDYVDILSPMAYYNLTHRSPEGIEKLIDELSEKYDYSVVPAIQTDVIVRYMEDEFSIEEFQSSLDHALSKNSDGVILFVWHWESFMVDFARKEILKETVQ